MSRAPGVRCGGGAAENVRHRLRGRYASVLTSVAASCQCPNNSDPQNIVRSLSAGAQALPSVSTYARRNQRSVKELSRSRMRINAPVSVKACSRIWAPTWWSDDTCHSSPPCNFQRRWWRRVAGNQRAAVNRGLVPGVSISAVAVAHSWIVICSSNRPSIGLVALACAGIASPGEANKAASSVSAWIDDARRAHPDFRGRDRWRLLAQEGVQLVLAAWSGALASETFEVESVVPRQDRSTGRIDPPRLTSLSATTQSLLAAAPRAGC
jgi:hypothetical protein